MLNYNENKCVLNCLSVTCLKNINCTLLVALKEYFNKLANTHIRSPAIHLLYMVLQFLSSKDLA